MNTGSRRGLNCNAYAGQSGDKMIAAQARSLGFTLVTDDTKDYAGIPGLSLDNWREPGDLETR